QRSQIFAVPRRIIVRDRLAIAERLRRGGVVNTPIGIDLAKRSILLHDIESRIDLLKQRFVVLSDSNAVGHSRRWKLDVFYLRPRSVVPRNRRIHDHRVEPPQGEVDKRLDLAVVAADRNAADSLNVTL